MDHGARSRDIIAAAGTRMNTYPMLNFIGRHGGWLAVVVSIAPLLAGIGVTACGGSPWWSAGGALLAAGAFVIVRSYVELVRVMIDMLLPK
jgi:hypothetical protein